MATPIPDQAELLFRIERGLNNAGFLHAHGVAEAIRIGVTATIAAFDTTAGSSGTLMTNLGTDVTNATVAISVNFPGAVATHATAVVRVAVISHLLGHGIALNA